MKGLYQIFRTTAHRAQREPIYYLVTLVFGFLVYMSRFFVVFVFEDQKGAILETGLVSIVATGVLLSLLLSWIIVRREMEQMSVLTVLSKPVSRTSFVVGKYLGLLWSIFLSLLLVFFLLQVGLLQSDLDHIRVQFFENNDIPTDYWNAVWLTVDGYTRLFMARWFLPALKGGLTAFITVSIVLSICLVSSLFLQILPTAGITIGFFLLGSLSGNIFHSLKETGNVLAAGFGWLIHLLFPNLRRLDVSGEVIGGPVPVTGEYLLSATVSGIIYICMVLAFGAALFHRTEIE